jgi:putative membrane protein
MDEILVRYLHFIGIFIIVSALFAEHMLLKKEMSGSELQKLARIDLFYGLTAIIVLVAGLILWFWVGKPSAFYTRNFLFHIKLTLFLVLGILSIYPSVFFVKNRKSKLDKIVVPNSIKILIRIELMILFIIPLLAVFMARGIGMF